MTVYIEKLTELSVMKLVGAILSGYTVMLVLNHKAVMVKELNYKLGIKLILGMAVV